MSQNNLDLLQLQQQAKDAATRAYAPYSQFKVGAVIAMRNGVNILGCNVENVSYGLSNCAERSAIFSAISQGIDLKDVAQLVIYTPSDRVYSPCGACRQVLAEFLAPTTTITSTCDTGQKSWTVEELLPHAFHFDIDEYRAK